MNCKFRVSSKKLILVFLFLFSSAVMAAAIAKDVWKGHVYPNSSDLRDNIYIGDYPSFDVCRDTAINILRRTEWIATGAFECGLNCRYEEEWDMYICKETVEWNLLEGFNKN